MGAVMDLNVIRANVWLVIQLSTFLHCTTLCHTHTHTQTHLHTSKMTAKWMSFQTDNDKHIFFGLRVFCR